MRLQTILNRVEKHPSFVYGHAQIVDSLAGPRLEVSVRARRKSRAACSRCGRRQPGFDRLAERSYEFIPVWGIPVFFKYRRRRVSCRCGVVVERLPWAEGKTHLTKSYQWFLARWARRLSWKEVATAFSTSWENVFRSVQMAVNWGVKHRDLGGIKAIGVDEIQCKHGQHYVTLVYQLDTHSRRLLWMGQERSMKTIQAFFDWFGEARTKTLKFVCSDMWQPYLRVVAETTGSALHVLDRFHIAANLNKAVDQVRRQEAGQLKAKGLKPVLKGARWLFLKRYDNLNAVQSFKLRQILRANLRTVRAYLLKEELDFLWSYVSPAWAGKFLDAWIRRVMRSRLEPLKTKARSMRRHRELIINWFRAKGAISNGIVEGFNNKARVVTKRAYGFRTYEALQVALLHALGDLPEPEHTHRFC